MAKSRLRTRPRKSVPGKRTQRSRSTTRPDTVRARAGLARTLFEEGRFDEALAHYFWVAAADPMHAAAHASIASLLTKRGDEAAGRKILQEFFARQPLGPKPKPGTTARPLVLRIRGFDKTRATIGRRRDGSFKRKLRGGHFTTRYLLMDPDFAVRTFTIARGNILAPGMVPPHDLLLNTIAEPDNEPASLASLAEYLARTPGTRIINRPDRVLVTTRDANYQRLREFPGVIFPKTIRLALDHAGPREIVDAFVRNGLQRPVILRRTGTQTGRTTALIEGPDDLTGYVGDGLTGDYYAIQFRRILWQDRYFRKLRLFHIDGTYYPTVCHLDKVWNVHGGNRKEIMRDRTDLMAEEQRFLEDWQGYVGATNVGHFERIAEATGLEFFGVDFTLDDDNAIFIFELNAAMRHSFDHARNFPYKLEPDQRVSDAFMAMVARRLELPATRGDVPSRRTG